MKQTVVEMSDDKVPKQAAALSFYTVFAIGPLMLIFLKLLGLVWERSELQKQIIGQFRGLIGAQGAEAIDTIMTNASQSGGGTVAAVLGILALLFAATGVFVELKDALNTVWDVPAENIRTGVKGIVWERLLSFAMIFAIGFLLMVSLFVSATLETMANYYKDYFPASDVLLSILNNVVSVGVFTLLFAGMFKFLPDTKIPLRDIWLGAFGTSLLFTLGKYLIGLYIGNASSVNIYGAAGSFAVLFLWIYYSSQIFFLGAEFTQVYYNRQVHFKKYGLYKSKAKAQTRASLSL